MRKILFILFILILCSFTSSVVTTSSNYKIQYTILPSFSTPNIDTVINPISNNFSKGWLYRPPDILRAGFYKISDVYYDVIVDVLDDKYMRGKKVEFTITIINKGKEPDMDGILIYYIEDPHGNVYQSKKEVFELVPPTCPDGVYDRYKDKCILGQKELEPKTFVLLRDLTIPDKGIEGEWKIYVTYESFVQPKIEVYDSFYVYKFLFKIFGKYFKLKPLIFIDSAILIARLSSSRYSFPK